MVGMAGVAVGAAGAGGTKPGFYETGPQHSIGLLARALPHDDPSRATALYSLLLGEPHRRRLLGLDPAPTRATADAHAARALALLGL
jgi:hypothetical protein